MALIDTEYFTTLAVIPPADQAAVNALSMNFRGQETVNFRIAIATVAEPTTLNRLAGFHNQFKRGSVHFDFWRGLLQQNLDLEDFPEGTTQADLDALYASVTMRYHNIQTEDDPDSPLFGKLVNVAGDGEWNAQDHWLAELGNYGLTLLQEPEPPVDRWVVTRAQLDALDPAISKVGLVNAVFPEYL